MCSGLSLINLANHITFQKECVGPGGHPAPPIRVWPGGCMSPSLLIGPWWSPVQGEWEGLSSLHPTVHRQGYWLKTHTDSSFNLKNQYIYHLKLWDGFHLELWGGGGCDEGALLLKGMEAEEGEEEDEVGRGEEVLQPSDITWTPSERHTESTQRIQNLETAVFIQYWVKYWIKTKRLKQKIGFWTQNKNL